MNNNKIQNCIVQQITEYLEKTTGAKFEIEHVSLKFFNKLSLQHVYVEDLSNEKMLSIDEVDAQINLFPLIKGEINIENITANNLSANLYTDSCGTLNIQFLIEAFKPKEKKQRPNIILPQITLNNASFRYKNYTQSHTNLYPWQFNTDDIQCDSIYTQICFSLIDQNNFDAKINYLKLNEKSGFKLTNLSTHVKINKYTLDIPYATFDLPHTHLSTDSILIKTTKDDDNNINWAKTQFKLKISQANIKPSDFKHFIPEFEKLKEQTSISAKIDGTLDDLKVSKLSLTYGNTISVDANIESTNLHNIKDSYFKCSINHIRFDKNSVQNLVTNISKQSITLPNEINNLGICQYSGTISGYLSNLVLYGNLNTAIGNIKTDFNLKIRDNFTLFYIDGRIGSNTLKLNKLLPKSELKNISFKSNSNIIVGINHPITAKTNIQIKQLEFKNYNYKNINIDGYFNPNLFSGKILLDDPNCYFNFDGKISEINKFKHFDFSAELRNLNLNKLNLIKTHPNLKISLSSKSDFSGDRWSTMAGYINIDSLHLINNDKEFFLNQLSLNAENEPITAASIKSDIINGSISGKYNIATLANHTITILSQSMPILNEFVKPTTKTNDITCILNIESLQPLLQTIEIPWYTTQKSSIYAHLNTTNNEIDAEIFIPNLTNGKNSIDSIDLKLNNKIDNIIDISLSAATNLKKSHLNASTNIKAYNNQITTTLNWDNNNTKKMFAGEIAFQTTLTTQAKNKQKLPNAKTEKTNLIIETKILPTELILQNKSWIIDESTIWSDLNKIIINNLKIHSNDNQLIAINGIASKNENEIIDIQLKDISLDYIDELLPEETKISFGGIVNGTASIANTLILPQINANVISKNFHFDDSYFGTAIAKCNFDHTTTSLKFDGTIINDNNDTTAILDGNYFIPKDSLDIKGKASGLDVAFLDYYLSDIIGNISGKAWGDVHIHGFTKNSKVAVDVAALAKDASIYIDVLETTFYFSDSIFVDKNIIQFGHIDIYDAEGHSGHIEGQINHEYFKKINLDLDINVNNILVMNSKRENSESFYGKVYATGTARIYGNEETIYITCMGQSNKGTNVIIPIDNYYASENSFIIFQNLQEIVNSNKKDNIKEPIKTNVILDMMLDITPDAHLDLIIDSKAGDMLTGSGSGNLRVTYDINADKMNIYGTVQVEEGKYIFTFQNVLRKEFYVKEGSSLIWTGDPIAANLNIDAYYQLTADLAEILDEAILSNTSRTSVPVQCLLNLTGLLTQPNIKFNLNLPNSEEELNRALQNTVNTDELMNRQIIALLILGKFIPPENLQSNVFTQNELYSVVSSTLSAQLNNWASQMLDNWGFGINFRTTGEGDTRTNEYEFNFVYTPTNRISINGNVGYRDDALSATPFIGDFDIEYKLNQSGKLRAKAYTHTNDYREFKKGLTTQGIGLIYSENFNTLKELWKTWQNNAKEAKIERQKRREERKLLQEEKKQQRKEKKQQKAKEKQEKNTTDKTTE